MFVFLAVALTPFVSFSAPQTLSKEKESKIIFMLFENQNRKTIALNDQAPNCKSQGLERSWFCDHKTVKSVLMSALFVGVPGDKFAKQSQVTCEVITKELRTKIEEPQYAGYGPKAFRREIAQSLDGQWVCRFDAILSQYDHVTHRGPEKIAAAETSQAGSKSLTHEEVHTSIFGLSFLLNREQTRIISRNIVARSNF